MRPLLMLAVKGISQQVTKRSQVHGAGVLSPDYTKESPELLPRGSDVTDLGRGLGGTGIFQKIPKWPSVQPELRTIACWEHRALF